VSVELLSANINAMVYIPPCRHPTCVCYGVCILLYAGVMLLATPNSAIAVLIRKQHGNDQNRKVVQ